MLPGRTVTAKPLLGAMLGSQQGSIVFVHLLLRTSPAMLMAISLPLSFTFPVPKDPSVIVVLASSCTAIFLTFYLRSFGQQKYTRASVGRLPPLLYTHVER